MRLDLRLRQNLLHFDARVVLTVTDGALVLLFALEFKNEDLVAAPVSGNFGPHSCRLEGITQNHLISLIRNCQNAVELHRRAYIAGDRVYFYGLPGRYAILLAAGFNDCVHDLDLFVGFGAAGVRRLK
jgi:hypothetical protein